jgi:hypothetical protein
VIALALLQREPADDRAGAHRRLVGWIGDRYGASTTLVVAAVGTALGAYATLRYLRRRGVPSETVVPAGSRRVAAPAPVGPV